MPIFNFLKDVFKGVWDLLFPPLCFNCQIRLEDEEHKICQKCWAKIPEINPEIINKKDRGKFLDKLESLWLFDNNFKNIVHYLKYSNCPSIGKEMGWRMGKYLLNNNELIYSNPILIPIPLHPVKKREREYNQSELIAKGIAEVTGLKVCNSVVKRTKDTKSQTKMNRDERMENMQNAFKFIKKPESQCIILIDDVFTTGTTMNCVAEVIKANNENIFIVGFSCAMPE